MTTKPTHAQMPTGKEVDLVKTIREAIKYGYSDNIVLECIRDHVAEEMQRFKEKLQKAKANEWKPIETAPNGCRILVTGGTFRMYGHDKNGNLQDIFEQSNIISVWHEYDEDSGETFHFLGGEFTESPTHWRPLPSNPVDEH